MKQLRYYQDKVGNIYELTTDLEKHLSLEIAQLNIKLKNIQDDNNKIKEVLDKIKEIFKVFKENGKEYYTYYEYYNISGEKVINILELLEEIE